MAVCCFCALRRRSPKQRRKRKNLCLLFRKGSNLLGPGIAKAGITVVEAPSERTATRAMGRVEGLGIVDTPPGNERITQSAVALAHAVVVPTRAGGVEYSRVLATLELIPTRIPRGVVICAARLGTNDLEAAIAWWKEQKVELWGVI